MSEVRRLSNEKLITKFAIHSTGGAIAPANDIASLKFINIDVTKRYKLTIYHSVGGVGAYANNLTVKDGVGGTSVLFSFIANPDGQSQQNSSIKYIEPNELTTGILSFDFTRTGSSNSSFVAVLEELSSHEPITDWD